MVCACLEAVASHHTILHLPEATVIDIASTPAAFQLWEPLSLLPLPPIPFLIPPKLAVTG